MADILSIDHLCGGYDQELYQDFSLHLHTPGRLITLVGPNGSGKSTLLKFLFKELPYRGTIKALDVDISTLSQKEIASVFSLVPQNGRIDYDFTVREAVAMAARDPHATEQALSLCHLTSQAERSVQALSGGEFQRTLIARALAQDSPIMLLDEPVGNLDIAQQIGIMRLFKQLTKQGKTIICVLHDIILTQVYSDEVVLLEHGQLVGQGEPSAVLTPDNLAKVYGVDTQVLTDSAGSFHLLSPLW